MRISVLLPNWVGDLVMATPALRTLREHLPDARIVGVAKPYLIPLLNGTSWLDTILPWDRSRGRLTKTIQVARQLRHERLDEIFLLGTGFQQAVIGRLSGAKRIAGYARSLRSWLLTDPIQPLHHGRRSTPVSGVDDYLHLIDQFGYTAQSRHVELTTTPADEQAADEIFSRLKLPDPSRIMLLNSSDVFQGAKLWPAEYCISLALRAVEEFGLTTIVMCGPHEREMAAAIENGASHPQVRSMAQEDVSFGVTKAIIRRSRLMVTTDSGPRHVASALGTPTVVLFGPIDPRWSRNYQRETIELRVDLECSPCSSRKCPLGHNRCMRDLTVDRVLQAVAQTLERPAQRRAA